MRKVIKMKEIVWRDYSCVLLKEYSLDDLLKFEVAYSREWLAVLDKEKEIGKDFKGFRDYLNGTFLDISNEIARRFKEYSEV